MRHDAGALDELPPGTKQSIVLGRLNVVVCRSEDGAVYALNDRCPHQGAPLSDGTLEGTTLPSEPGEYVYGRKREILRCPWHAYEFDVKTGCSLFGERSMQVRTYPVIVEEGRIFVDDGR
jgi:3-phenylpropionate/trans-cinnamate dioxygenase ferredoxin subunit